MFQVQFVCTREPVQPPLSAADSEYKLGKKPRRVKNVPGLIEFSAQYAISSGPLARRHNAAYRT